MKATEYDKGYAAGFRAAEAHTESLENWATDATPPEDMRKVKVTLTLPTAPRDPGRTTFIWDTIPVPATTRIYYIEVPMSITDIDGIRAEADTLAIEQLVTSLTIKYEFD